MKGSKLSNSFLQSFASHFENPKPNSILYNRALLYFILVLSLFQLYTFSVAGNMGAAMIFLLVGFLTSFFSKNMIVILVIALAFTGILQFGVHTNAGFEGMVEGSTENTNKKNDTKETVPSTDTDTLKKTEDTTTSENKQEQMIESIRMDGTQLEKLQTQILSNFQQISPYMNQAEVLVNKMQDTASQLNNVPNA